MHHFQLHWKKIQQHSKHKGDSSMGQIPVGSKIQKLKNGDVLITFSGAMVPTLCVQKDQYVRRAIIPEPVNAEIAEAARQYVAQHLPQEQSGRE